MNSTDITTLTDLYSEINILLEDLEYSQIEEVKAATHIVEQNIEEMKRICVRCQRRKSFDESDPKAMSSFAAWNDKIRAVTKQLSTYQNLLIDEEQARLRRQSNGGSPRFSEERQNMFIKNMRKMLISAKESAHAGLRGMTSHGNKMLKMKDFLLQQNLKLSDLESISTHIRQSAGWGIASSVLFGLICLVVIVYFYTRL